MVVIFSVRYPTAWGERIAVTGSCPELGSWDLRTSPLMTYGEGDIWSLALELPPDLPEFEYKYVLKTDEGRVMWEAGENRRFSLLEDAGDPARRADVFELRDSWRDLSDPENIFLTSAFRDVIFARHQKSAAPRTVRSKRMTRPAYRITFRVAAPKISPDHVVCVSGSLPQLGSWDVARAVPMDASSFPVWTADIALDAVSRPFSYQYLVRDKKGRLVSYEEGEYRPFVIEEHLHREGGKVARARGGRRAKTVREHRCIITDDRFASSAKWRGAGVAVPVFALRSDAGLGTGEFPDLKLLVDWASRCGLNLIQLLPVNDTSVNRMWWDSYPYSNLSVFALHPLYLNIQAIGGLPRRMADEIAVAQRKLNACDHVSYEEVMACKLKFARELFVMQKASFLASKAFRAFFDENSFWLTSYAAFSSLRDLYETSDTAKWGAHASMNDAALQALVAPGSPQYDSVACYYFIQYHLHLQLDDASRYARSKRIILKGDIPIGVNKHSDVCWRQPQLFHMDQSAGAPPDPFSDTGQNWGFPTYDWDRMSLDGYAWWRSRLRQMSRYFQMIRLDHVLGFFRIWEIPDTMVSGLMGHFNPAIPLWRDELERQGIWDFDRLCEPYIPLWLVRIVFGPETNAVIATYLESAGQGQFRLRQDLKTQRQIESYFAIPAHTPDDNQQKIERIRSGLLYLVTNVVLFRDPHRPGFHPRVNMADTPSFATLDEGTKEKLVHLYNEYYYHRQEEFWRAQGMTRLPVLKAASDMLICGEDLGMVPECVPEVMRELCILGLRIQRMPKEAGREFGVPAEYDYLTVCTTSSHDMSTLRGWWGEDPARTHRYYADILKKDGEPPASAEPDICREIIAEHLASPSLWAIFPIQDILALDKDLRRPGDPREEQINDPANPHHYWKFRLHLSLEKLNSETAFAGSVAGLMKETGRGGAS